MPQSAVSVRYSRRAIGMRRTRTVKGAKIQEAIWPGGQLRHLEG
jgi:hypothetical protein